MKIITRCSPTLNIQTFKYDFMETPTVWKTNEMKNLGIKSFPLLRLDRIQDYVMLAWLQQLLQPLKALQLPLLREQVNIFHLLAEGLTRGLSTSKCTKCKNKKLWFYGGLLAVLPQAVASYLAREWYQASLKSPSNGANISKNLGPFL